MIKVPLIEIERFAVHDGPGIRSVVFLKGCPLHCPWCANPESQRREPEEIRKDGKLVWVGKPVDIEEVMAVLERDADYYQESGGGVTFSGGECMMHTDVLLSLLQHCKERGWHTAIETSGMAPTASFEKIFPFADLFLFDLKHTDPIRLKEVTGADLDLIKKNLSLIVSSLSHPSSLILRLPCIPAFNMEKSFIEEVFAIALEYGINRVDLLPYHVLGVEKYHQLGREYPYPVSKGVNPGTLIPYEQYGRTMGLDVQIV